MRNLCDQKSIGFVLDVDKSCCRSKIWRRLFRKQPRELKNMCRERGFYKMLVFHDKYNANGNMEVAWRYHNAAWKRQNIDYFIGFIYGCDFCENA